METLDGHRRQVLLIKINIFETSMHWHGLNEPKPGTKNCSFKTFRRYLFFRLLSFALVYLFLSLYASFTTNSKPRKLGKVPLALYLNHSQNTACFIRVEMHKPLQIRGISNGFSL